MKKIISTIAAADGTIQNHNSCFSYDKGDLVSIDFSQDDEQIKKLSRLGEKALLNSLSKLLSTAPKTN